jgi:outer membrane cobalamin receptor
VRTSYLAATCLLCTVTGVAADPATIEDTMIITATRTRVARDEVLVPVIVIDRATIERSGALDLAGCCASRRA